MQDFSTFPYGVAFPAWGQQAPSYAEGQLFDRLGFKIVPKEFDFCHVSDAIGDEYEKWEVYDAVFIDAPTGTGKTTFVYEKLIDKAIRKGFGVMLVSNRIALSLQQKLRIYDIVQKLRPEALDDLKRDTFTKSAGKDIALIGPVCVVTYQSLSKLFNPGFDAFNDPKKADEVKKLHDWSRSLYYAVFDEIHFLYADAEFNGFCSYLLNYIPYVFRDVIRVYMTATSWQIKDYILKYEDHKYIRNENNPPPAPFMASARTKQVYRQSIDPNHYPTIHLTRKFYDYHINPDYSRFNLRFFNKQQAEVAVKLKHGYESAYPEDKPKSKKKKRNTVSKATAVLNIMEPLPSKDDKWIVFVDSKSEGDSLKNALNEVGVTAAYIDREISEPKGVRDSIISRERFDQPVLITTQVIDSGVNICDESVKNIVIFYTDRTQFIQALGRKRLESGETGINVWAWVPDRDDFLWQQNKYERNIAIALEVLCSAELLKRELSNSIITGLVLPAGWGTNFPLPAIQDIVLERVGNTLIDEQKGYLYGFLTSSNYALTIANHCNAWRISDDNVVEMIYKMQAHFSGGYIDNFNQLLIPEFFYRVMPLCGAISAYLNATNTLHDAEQSGLINSLFYHEDLGMYTASYYTIGVLLSKANFISQFTYEFRTIDYRRIVEEWLDKKGVVDAIAQELTVEKKATVNELVNWFEGNLEKRVSENDFLPIKLKIVKAYIEWYGIIDSISKPALWHGFKAKKLNGLLKTLNLEYSVSVNRNVWTVSKNKKDK